MRLGKKINHRLIQARRAYEVHQLAELLGVHCNTIHRWINQYGLKRMDNKYPYMLFGQTVIDFILKHKEEGKIYLQTGEFRCAKCKAARKPENGKAELFYRSDKQGILKGICECCGSKICLLISLSKLPELKAILHITPPAQSALVQSTTNRMNSETEGGINDHTL